MQPQPPARRRPSNVRPAGRRSGNVPTGVHVLDTRSARTRPWRSAARTHELRRQVLNADGDRRARRSRCACRRSDAARRASAVATRDSKRVAAPARRQRSASRADAASPMMWTSGPAAGSTIVTSQPSDNAVEAASAPTSPAPRTTRRTPGPSRCAERAGVVEGAKQMCLWKRRQTAVPARPSRGRDAPRRAPDLRRGLFARVDSLDRAPRASRSISCSANPVGGT